MLQIDDFYELNALLSAMLTFKFEMPVSDSDVREAVASTLLASVLHDTYDATIVAARKMGNESFASSLIDGRSASGHPRELEKACEHVRSSQSHWNKLSQQEKRDCFRIILSPFEVDDVLCDSLISECDERD